MLSFLSPEALTAIQRRRAELLPNNSAWALDPLRVPETLHALIEDAEFFSPFSFYEDDAQAPLNAEYVEAVLSVLERCTEEMADVDRRVDAPGRAFDAEANAFSQLARFVRVAAWRLGVRPRPPVDEALAAIALAFSARDEIDSN